MPSSAPASFVVTINIYNPAPSMSHRDSTSMAACCTAMAGLTLCPANTQRFTSLVMALVPVTLRTVTTHGHSSWGSEALPYCLLGCDVESNSDEASSPSDYIRAIFWAGSGNPYQVRTLNYTGRSAPWNSWMYIQTL